MKLLSCVRDTMRLLSVNIFAVLLSHLYYLHLYKESYTSNLANKGIRVNLLFVLPDGKHVVT